VLHPLTVPSPRQSGHRVFVDFDPSPARTE
jgi:hypothetical protein